ncbi:MAG: TIGR02221 family CRISPR-associated protein [Methanotrichaceae archaeon]
MKRPKILLTALGTRAYDSTYRLGDEVSQANLAPIALVRLLGNEWEFDEIVVLCTDKAREETYSILEDGVRPISCRLIMIPDGRDNQELSDVVRKIMEGIPESADLTLDITHGLRSMPFLFFASSLYLSALKNVEIKGAWYGMVDSKNQDGTCPFVDLSIILEVVEWFWAAKAFRDMSDPLAIAELMERKISISKENLPNEQKASFSELTKFTKAIQGFGRNYAAALPLELGKMASEIDDIYAGMEVRPQPEIIPLQEDMLRQLAASAREYSISASGRGWRKEDQSLSLGEVQRQARLVDRYLKYGQYNNAIGLMRELVVSRVMLKIPRRDLDLPWLDRPYRKQVERSLGSLASFYREGRRNELASCWNEIIGLRNNLHHHGMNTDKVRVDKSRKRLEEIWHLLEDNMEEAEFWNLAFGGGGGTLFISPLGLHPGFLYTALSKLRNSPHVCLVVASEDSAVHLEEIKNRSGYEGELNSLIMDPHHGFEDIAKLVQRSKEILLGADEVMCNITGGTTTLQYAVIQLAKMAEKLGRKVNWIAVVDERDSEEQNAEPYVLGDIVEIEEVRL